MCKGCSSCPIPQLAKTNSGKKVKEVKTSHIRVREVYLQNKHAYGLRKWCSYTEVATKVLHS